MPTVTATWAFTNGGRFDYSNNPIIAGNNGDIAFQCQGIRINANVTVTDLTAVPSPSMMQRAMSYLPTLVSGPVQQGSTFEIGFVQILESSRMEATYQENVNTSLGRLKNKTTQYWSQKVTPCYDCQTNDIPWYDPANGKAVIAHGGAYALSMNDFPQLNVSTHLNRPGHANNGQPLLGVVKDNSFSIYLMLREVGAGNTTRNKWIIKGGTWSVITEWKTNANWAANMFSSAGYTQIADKLTWDDDCTFSSTALFGLPEWGTKIDADKGGKAGANANQTGGDRWTTPLTYWSF